MTDYLSVTGVSARFGGLQALSDVSLTVDRGEIRGLIGPNGAGKTTLFNVLSRFTAPSSGQIRFKGLDVLALRPHELVAVGIARTFQNPRIFGGMTVLDNVLVGATSRLRPQLLGSALRLPGDVRRERTLGAEARSAIARVGLEDRADAHGAALLFSQQRLLELARALVAQPELILLDEPFSGLTREESQRLVELLSGLVDRGGVTILVIEHDMEIVMRFCQRLTVLNFGRKIAEGRPKEVQNDPDVVQAYLGEETL